MESPNPNTIKRLLDRYAPAPLKADVRRLASGDRKALRKLVECGPWIDKIYWKQRSATGESIRNHFANSQGDHTRDLQRLLDINFGPWDNLNHDEPFIGDERKPLGGNFYPDDLSREEFLDYVANENDDHKAKTLLSPTTLIRRSGANLVAIPYCTAYRNELAVVSGLLLEASELTTSESFRAFLQSRAKEITTDSLTQSDELWVQTAGSSIDLVIGPYEVYDDGLLGIKTSYEAIVMVLHPMTFQLREFEAVAARLEHRLPGVVSSSEARPSVAIGVYDAIWVAGMTNMGSKLIAATLPNDEFVRAKFGSRLLLFRNVISAKFTPILVPLARRVLSREQLNLVQESPFLYHTLLHEMAHALSTGFVSRGSTVSDDTIHQSLREYYSTIEECRADLVGMVFLDLLADSGFLPDRLRTPAIVTFVVNILRIVRFGGGEDHGRAAAVTLSHLLRSKALMIDNDRKLSINTEMARNTIGRLAEHIQDIAVNGKYEDAAELVMKFAAVPSEIQSILQSVEEDVPTDLEFVQDPSL